jgi:hypothetical protein
MRVGKTTCQKCHRPVAWVQTRGGKKIAIDYWENPERGDYVVSGREGDLPVMSRVPKVHDAMRLAGVALFTCHFDTCPARKRFRAMASNAPTPRRAHTQRYLRG